MSISRTFLQLALILLIALPSFAQYVPDMMESTGDFREIRAAADNYFQGKQDERGKGFKPYKRWEYFVEGRLDDAGQVPGAEASSILFDVIQGNNTSSRGEGYANWTTKGPFDVPIAGYGAGRINCAAFHPSNPDIIFVGSPAGGLWKTTDGGMSWTTYTDQLAILGVTDILINPTNPDVMYIATGDAYGSHTYSMGVLKSIDGGYSWNTTGLSWGTGSTAQIYKLQMVPGEPNTILAATKTGIYKTYDGGQNWALSKPGTFRDMEFKPGDPATVYAVTNSTFWVSNDTGNTFSINMAFQASSTVERLSLAVTPDDASYIYILSVKNSDSGFEGLYQSIDGGATFTKRASSPNLLGWNTSGTDSGGQGWYDLALAVSPSNKNLVVVGGVNAWRSMNGGGNWSLIAHWTGGAGKPNIHADVHELVYNPSNNKLYACTDGGIYFSNDNGSSWTDRSDGLSIAQIYRIGVSQTDPGLVISGWQDNGSSIFFNGSSWKKVLGGDGMECIIDYVNPNYMYGSLYYGSIKRSTNGGLTWGEISNSITEQGAWVTPYVMDNGNPSILYAAYNNLWKSTNRGNSWTKVSNLSSTATIRSLAVAPTNNQIIYMANQSTLFKSVDGGNTWTNITAGLSYGYISDIAVSSHNPNHVFVTKLGYYDGTKVFRSRNGGSSWTNISAGLPNLPANTIVYENGKADAIYVGLDAGVYYRDSLMTQWVPYNDNLPNVLVYELEIQYSDHKLVAATHGRGLWMTDTWDWINALPDNPGDAELQLRIFPNPSSDLVNISPAYALYEQGSMNILDGLGKTVRTYAFDEFIEAMQVDLSDLPAGIYFVRLQTSSGIRQARFVRSH